MDGKTKSDSPVHCRHCQSVHCGKWEQQLVRWASSHPTSIEDFRRFMIVSRGKETFAIFLLSRSFRKSIWQATINYQQSSLGDDIWGVQHKYLNSTLVKLITATTRRDRSEYVLELVCYSRSVSSRVMPDEDPRVFRIWKQRQTVRVRRRGGTIDRLNDVEHQAVSRLDNGNNDDDDDVSLDRSVSSSGGVCRLVLVVIIIVFNPTYARFLLVRFYFIIFLSLIPST